MPQRALPNNQEDREVYLREHDAGDFIEAIRSTETKKADTLIMMLDAFLGEPELLYVALNYARPRRHDHYGTAKPRRLAQDVPSFRYSHKPRRHTANVCGQRSLD